MLLVCTLLATVQSGALDPPLPQPVAPALPDDAAPAAVAPAPAVVAAPQRVAVTELAASGIPDTWRPVVQSALLAELRKLAHTSVIGMDEVRAMLDLEAQKQLVGCSDTSCLSEIAEALGVDVLITGSMARVGDEHVFTLKRIDQRRAQVAGGVTRRFVAGNGEEFLAVLGPTVAELFPDVALRSGAQRGVPKELALRLNPPPLPPSVLIAGAATAGVALAGAAGLFAVNLAAVDDHAKYVATADPFDKRVEADKDGVASNLAVGAWVAGGTGAALALTSAVAFFFTDFSSLVTRGD